MNFIRLHVTAEGQTEERFVKRVLCPHLGSSSIATDVCLVLTSKDRRAHREFRGGMRTYQRPRQDIATWLKEDQRPEARFTTMFDLYALPPDFPGFDDAANLNDPYGRVAKLEDALAADIDDRRFLPYIQLHEFEALVFADPATLLDDYLERETEIQALSQLPLQFGGNPELIDDGPDTAPSKRILTEIPEYSKAQSGPSAAERIGLPRLRGKCRHFAEWLSQLEQLGA